ncbi:uncharacterized protein LOC128771686 isoform X2 [Synchiropus splendidus]|uniref:uncharacterized protein LOC128771686 isoform X2 n=1 Tax=Synchiropus splendidus TaxID=270530 RepID=UPI00237E6339|nr:uncharacterized protein LOC128771686 isoform X2 [Synchiropus splendidus]
MSITMSKAEGVTVVTVAANPNSSLPPICQILKNLCYSPVCCSVSESMRRLQGGCQYALGFILFGVVCILSERFPSPCLIIINQILNLCGVASAIAGIAIYSTSLARFRFWLCNDYYWSTDVRLSAQPRIDRLRAECLEAKSLLIMAVQGIMSLLIILSALQMCLCISSSVLGIKALKKRKDSEEKCTCDPESDNLLLQNDDNSMA